MKEDAQLHADVVIVGSGIAGAMTAYQLARRNLQVLVLEAGPRITRQQTVNRFMRSHKLDLSAGYPNSPFAQRPDWSGEDPQDYVRQMGPAVDRAEFLKVVGGTTWHWAGIAMRLTPADLTIRSRYGVGVDWPLDYAELEPYYLQAEREIGVSGDSVNDTSCPRSAPFPLPPYPLTWCNKVVLRRLKDLGVTFHPRPVARNSRAYDGRSQCVGYGTCSPICPSGAQYNASVHVAKAEQLGVRVEANARVDALLPDDTGRIQAALVTRPDGGRMRVTAKTFVLAANAVESTRLLLMSADNRFPDGLANASGRVGRHYCGHPGIRCRFLMPEPVYNGRGPESTIVSYTFRDGPFRSERAGWSLSIYNRAHIHDITNELLNSQVRPPELMERIRTRTFHEVEMDTHMEQLPDFDNRLTIDRNQLDAAGLPHLQLHYRFGAYEQAGFEHIRSTFLDLTQAMNAEVLEISDHFSHHHMIGTCRMGVDRTTSVVDPDCRSHDHHNLYLAGSAVFPTGGTANPTLTIAALAIRSAEKIAADLTVGVATSARRN